MVLTFVLYVGASNIEFSYANCDKFTNSVASKGIKVFDLVFVYEISDEDIFTIATSDSCFCLPASL